ncbi:hypothetical protein LO762_19795 [Actinocorallia sp. API 0066]|uniref:hypothetical protein n=1 Tax=Actinocorallia sp. API 0066 TaxID=2896846 RepID=UPI001E5B5B59|nr:hypothetical protein [Actinocorallia sp. API 0066]MCD0451422.1 hypothetical protein [Actinocorallia sp. API 0066]
MRADFDRVYSPPEPPSSRRIPGPRGWRLVLGVLIVTAAALFFVLPLVWDEPDRELAGPATTTVSPSGEPSAQAPVPSAPPSGPADPPTRTDPPSPAPTQGPPASSGGGIIEALPKKVCESVPKAVFLKYVPEGGQDAHGGTTAGSCGYTGPDKKAFRYLRLETRLGNIAGDADPLGVTKWAFGEDYKRESEDKITRTLVLERVPNLGEEAFQRVFTDKGSAAKTTTARVEVRVQNVIITVTYSRAYRAKAEDEQGACLEGALAVAREALKLYG